MRLILCACLLITAAVLISGCSQQSPPAVTPVPTLSPERTAVVPVSAATITGPVAPKQIDISAFQSGSDVIVKYTGGADAADLTALVISVQSFTMQNRNEREENPVIGQQYVFPQMGTASPDVVTVTGIFRDGTEQELLQTEV